MQHQIPMPLLVPPAASLARPLLLPFQLPQRRRRTTKRTLRQSQPQRTLLSHRQATRVPLTPTTHSASLRAASQPLAPVEPLPPVLPSSTTQSITTTMEHSSPQPTPPVCPTVSALAADDKPGTSAPVLPDSALLASPPPLVPINHKHSGLPPSPTKTHAITTCPTHATHAVKPDNAPTKTHAIITRPTLATHAVKPDDAPTKTHAIITSPTHATHAVKSDDATSWLPDSNMSKHNPVTTLHQRVRAHTTSPPLPTMSDLSGTHNPSTPTLCGKIHPHSIPHMVFATPPGTPTTTRAEIRNHEGTLFFARAHKRNKAIVQDENEGQTSWYKNLPLVHQHSKKTTKKRSVYDIPIVLLDGHDAAEQQEEAPCNNDT